MKKNKAILTVIIVIAALVGSIYYAATVLQSTSAGEGNNIKLGLDLAGGVSITYQVEGEDDPSQEDIDDTVYKLQKRLEDVSTEVGVYQEGDDRITVEIPGVTDANEILEEIGKPGTLEFQDEDGNVILTGDQVVEAQAASQNDSTYGNKEYIVQLTFSDEGAEIFAEYTTDNVGNRLSIVYDDEVISAPTIKQAITGGVCQIDGMEDYEEAENLASYIRIGGLSLELTELNSSVVGAQLGTEAISTSLKAGAIGLAIIIIFMIIVYYVPGVVAGIALIFYTALEIMMLYLFDITLTLPGIAGIILSIGMAVDANVIIYARIREEIAAGQPVNMAIKYGFKKATSAIVDGNVTTFIAAVVLLALGSGTVKGFAYTLAIGIVLSMFTALVVSRFLMQAVYALGARDAKLYGKAKKRKSINFLGKKALWFAISVFAICFGLVYMGINASQGNGSLNYGLDFVGGTSTTATFDKDYTVEEISSDIVPVVEEITGDANVQTQKVAGTNQIVIKTRSLTLDEREQLNASLADNFGVDESTISTDNISGTISGEMRQDAVVAIIIAVIIMLAYIWFRFKDIRFGASAVIALSHDVLVVLSCYSLCRLSVGNTFIAVMLTIVGYSINATIVIFDRIRENLKPSYRSKAELAEMVNGCITDTLTRTMYTTFTTFVMVACMYILGVSSIREFSLPLMVGIIAGAYSSVFVTGALWYLMKKGQIKEK